MRHDEAAFEIADLDAIEALVEPYDWAFARENAVQIEEIWQRETALTPDLFDGEVLLQHQGWREGRLFKARYSITRYKPFLAWVRLGSPPPFLRNGFAMAALQSRDGAFLLGEMGSNTANAGKIYFPAGTPDRGDIKADKVDLLGSVLRELTEETGLLQSEVELGPGWRLVWNQVRAAFMRPVRIDLTAEAARALILSRIRTQESPELRDIHIIRDAKAIDPARMPAFQIAFLRHALAV